MDTTTVDLLSLIEKDTALKKVAATSGGEYHGACPFCGGKDRFIVQPQRGRWSCRQCSPRWQDAISYTQQRENLDFKGACEQLGLISPAPIQHLRRLTPPTPIRTESPVLPPAIGNLRHDYPALTDPAWQTAASHFVDRCVHNLRFTKSGIAVWHDYLMEKRGLNDAVLWVGQIGYNPRDQRAQWGQTAVWLPRGIVIPYFNHGLDQCWKINIRRLGQVEPKYVQVKGGVNTLYQMLGRIWPTSTVILVEGELDALAIRTTAAALASHDLRVVPVATGSSTGGRVLRWVTDVMLAERVLLAFDADEAGDQAAAWWLEALGGHAQRLRPTRKDPGEMLARSDNLATWITTGVACG